MKTIRPEELAGKHFDICIFVCGYETRASYVASKFEAEWETAVILDYECGGILQYDANRAFYEKFDNSSFLPISDDLIVQLAAYLENATLPNDPETRAQIFIDISSCSRSVMAKILLAVSETLRSRAQITCAYALSSFDNPPDGELPSHISEPVIGDLSGWSDDLFKPPCAVIGLGFEPGRALGCMDYLEIPEVRLFMPVGVDERFKEAVREANSVLISEAGSLSVLPYEILDPAATYEKMESLIHGLLAKFRPVIIPLGPKIFAALAMILAIRTFPRVCVWRTSSGTIGETADRKASGEIAIFTTLF